MARGGAFPKKEDFLKLDGGRAHVKWVSSVLPASKGGSGKSSRSQKRL